jgi:hypothetical protein
MKMSSVVQVATMQNMNSPENLLDACRMLVDQELMLDVAATMAATQPEITAAPMRAREACSTLSLHWIVREPEMKRTA